MKYRFIESHIDEFSVTRMCRMVSIKRSAYYAWKKRGQSVRSLENECILSKIVELRADKKIRTYGSPRLTPELRDAGFICNHKRVERIMRENGIRAHISRKHRYKQQKNKTDHIADNVLDRQFEQDEINKAWGTDITYISTYSGWAYLCMFLDLCSKKVVGWSVSSNPNTDLVLEALAMAVRNRNPDAGLIIHSDQGCQYTSGRYRDYLRDHGYIQSMSRRGNCWDNACAESFFGHLKQDIIFENKFQSVSEVELILFEYIEGFYNLRRRHSACGNISPHNYEKKLAA